MLILLKINESVCYIVVNICILGNPLEQALTYRLVFIDRVLDAACVLGHPGGVEYGDTGHAQYRRWQSEVDAGWRNLKQKIQMVRNGSKQPCFVRRYVLNKIFSPGS